MGREEVEEEEEVEQGELYIVRKVKDMRRNKETKHWEFFVRWKGYPPEDNTWEGAQAFTDVGLYQPFLDKLSKLRKATLAKEGPALRALRKARWDLEEAIVSMKASMAADAPRAAQSRAEAPSAAGAVKAPKKRALPADNSVNQRARELPAPSGDAAGAASAAAPKTIEPSSAAAPSVTTSASSGAANAGALATAGAGEEEWLQMLVRREKTRAPVPYAEVDFILERQQKKAGGKLVPAYLVRWRGADPVDDTWVVATRVKKAPRGPEAIEAFEQRAGAQAAPEIQEKQHASQPGSLKARPATGKASSGKAMKTVASVGQPAAIADKTERATSTSQKRSRDTADVGSAAQPKKKKSDTPPLRAAAASASDIERAVELRTGLQISQMNADHRELLDEFEQWQLTGQVKPPTEKTCRKYFQKFKKFLHTDYEEYDISAKWDLCNERRHEELMRRVKGSARNKKDHGECSASLAKFFLFLEARAQGWTSSEPVATRAGDTSDKTRGVQSREQGGAKSQASKQVGKAALEKQKASSKRAEETKKTKKELQQLLEKNRLREERLEAKKAKKHAKHTKHTNRHDGAQEQQPSSVTRHDRQTSKPSSSAAEATSTEMDRLHARMSSLPDTGAQPKLGAIPKKRRPAAAADSTDAILEWQGIPVECDLCKSGITKGRACRSAMVDGRIFCNTCLPAECRPTRDAWAKARLSSNAVDMPRQPADERSSGHRPGSRPRSGASDAHITSDLRVEPPRPMKSSRLCKFFNTPKGCYRGESCRFRHEQCERPEAVSHRSEPARVARYAPGQHPDQIPHEQQHQAAQSYAAEHGVNGVSLADQIPQGSAQATAFNTYDYGRDERTNRDTTKTEQAWKVIMMQDTVRRMDAMEQFPRGVLNHVISWKLSEALGNSFEDFKRLFDQLLRMKMEEQHKRELRDETTTCAKRWEAQTYEVDEQMMMKLNLKDVSYDSKRIITPARGRCCRRNDAPVFDLCSHVLSKVETDVKAQQLLDYKHEQDPEKHPRRGRAVFGAWPCPFCGKKAQCGCGWLDLEVDPTVVNILQLAPRDVDAVQVYCPSGDPTEPTAPSSPLEGGTIPILLENMKKEVIWRVPSSRPTRCADSARSALPSGADYALSTDLGGGGAVVGGSDSDDAEEVDLT